jgi:hypothetical protein
MKYAANEVNLDQEFSLTLGQSIMIAGENLAIKFIEDNLRWSLSEGSHLHLAGRSKLLN